MNASARLLLRGLKANLAAGARLALFLRVSPYDFRISAAHYAVLVAAGFGFWLAGGVLREGFPGALSLPALSVAMAQIPLLLFASMLAAAIFQRPALMVAFAVVLTSSDLVFEIAGTALHFGSRDARVAAYGGIVNWIFIGWALATALRGQWILTGWRAPRSIAAAGVLVLMLALLVWAYPRTELWEPLRAAPDPAQAPSVVREDLFHLQGALLDLQLSQLERERPGVEDMYFIGVAPYGAQDTFARELRVVKGLMDERFDTMGRSLALVNHPATLAELPIATASNLRAAIAHIAAGINIEEDVLFLFLTTHGSQAPELAFDLPPLRLQQLTPTSLARMFNDAGIKWKVVVISACYSGGFVEPLRDDNTLVITAADATHQSFGCELDSDFTWFSKAYFDEALRGTRSFTDAFELARRAVVERERREGREPSNPQMILGRAMRDKLASMQKRLEAAGAGATSGIADPRAATRGPL
jgi:hypothetical protein